MNDHDSKQQHTRTQGLNHTLPAPHTTAIAQRVPTSPPAQLQGSPRVETDSDLNSVLTQQKVLGPAPKKGAKAPANLVSQGPAIVKLQSLLVDTRFLAAGSYTPGTYDKATAKAVTDFQTNPTKGLTTTGITTTINPISGESDQVGVKTIRALNNRIALRKDYIQSGQGGPPTDTPKALTTPERDAAKNALNPQTSKATGHPKSNFTPTVNGYAYKDAVFDSLKKNLFTKYGNYSDQKSKRSNPTNLHSKPDMEQAANQAKALVDEVYGKYAKGKSFKSGTNLLDQWERQDAINQKADKGNDKKLRKLADAMLWNWTMRLHGVHKHFGASPDGAAEKKHIQTAINNLLNNKVGLKVISKVLQIAPGINTEGAIMMQRFKDTMSVAGPGGQQKSYSNIWKIFYTAIHEYIHTLRHSMYETWMSKVSEEKKYILNEGMCEFLTANVCTYIAGLDKKRLIELKKNVENNPTNTSSDVPSGAQIRNGKYAQAHQAAERLIGAVGIQNAFLGYFKGNVEQLGAAPGFEAKHTKSAPQPQTQP